MPAVLRRPHARPADGRRRASRAASTAARRSTGRDDVPRLRPGVPAVEAGSSRDRPAVGDEPDRRGVLRRPGLAAVPALGAALPLVPGAGRGRGAAAGPPAPARRRPGAGARGRDRRRREPAAPAAGLGRLRRRHRADPARRPASTGSPRWPAGSPGPRRRRCRSTTRRSTPSSPSAGSTTSATPPRPSARCGGWPGRARSLVVADEIARPLPVRARPPARPRGGRPLVAAA